MLRRSVEYTQYVGIRYPERLAEAGIEPSVGSLGDSYDNVFVERLWRSVKYERVYLKAYDSVTAARADIADYMGWYNAVRGHSSLEEFTPDEHYFAHLPTMKQAA